MKAELLGGPGLAGGCRSIPVFAFASARNVRGVDAETVEHDHHHRGDDQYRQHRDQASVDVHASYMRRIKEPQQRGTREQMSDGRQQPCPARHAGANQGLPEERTEDIGDETHRRS